MTMTLISTITVGAGGAASMDFTSIPQTYTDLVLYLSARNLQDDTRSVPSFNFNNDTGANYASRVLRGSGSAASSFTLTSQTKGEFYYQAGNITSNTFGSGSLYIPNYTGSTTKSWSIDSTSEGNSAESFMAINAGIYNSTSAITRITINKNVAANLEQYTTASLYGIIKGSGGATVS
jgi:hypothetical protein